MSLFLGDLGSTVIFCPRICPVQGYGQSDTHVIKPCSSDPVAKEQNQISAIWQKRPNGEFCKQWPALTMIYVKGEKKVFFVGYVTPKPFAAS